MIAKDIICNNFPVLQPNDNCEKAIDLMTEFNVAEIPIVSRASTWVYAGRAGAELFDVPISEIKTMHEPVSVLEQTHIFEIIKVFVNSKLTLMPVVDGNANYIGTITIKELFQAFADISSLDEPGGILVLEMTNRDYSLAEIARICENNNAKIICAYANVFPDENRMEVTLKLNRQNLSDVIANLERYDYVITSTFQESEYTQDLKERYDSLMKYLDI